MKADRLVMTAARAATIGGSRTSISDSELSRLVPYSFPACNRKFPIFRIDGGTEFQLVRRLRGLGALVPAPELDWDDEEVLSTMAELHPNLVVDFFAARLERERDPDSRYEAIPYQFSKLNEVLVKASSYVVASARAWYARDPSLFMYRGGRFVVNVFAGNWSVLEGELSKFVAGDPNDVEFVLQILRGYEGESFLHPLIKQIVNSLDPGSECLNEIEIILEASGVVSGEFGFVELHQQRREVLKTWLDDPRERVREYAARHIRRLENRIAAEQQRAESDYELRRRDWGEDVDSSETPQ